MKKQVLLYLSLILFLFSCVKEDKRWVELPPLSGNGSNYLAFYINGKPYINDMPYKAPGFFRLGPYRGGVCYGIWTDTLGENWVSIEANGGEMKNSFTMNLQVPIAEGQYDLNNLYKGNKLMMRSEYLEGYELDITKSNAIIITRVHDRVLAGTFFMNFRNTINEVIKIEDGRFDIGKE